MERKFAVIENNKVVNVIVGVEPEVYAANLDKYFELDSGFALPLDVDGVDFIHKDYPVGKQTKDNYYVFLTANKVIGAVAFAEQNDDLATQICIDANYDKFIWLKNSLPPARGATYDKASNVFTAPKETPTKPVK
jgi:hypothetical protein